MLSHFCCVWLCDPMDYSPPGSCVHGILQVRILEWVVMPSCRGSSWSRDLYVSHMAGRFFTTSTIWDGFPVGSDSKESACNGGDLGSIPGLGRFPGGGHGNPVQCSCLENPHGQRSLVGYSPWDCKESDTTEWLSTTLHSTTWEALISCNNL